MTFISYNSCKSHRIGSNESFQIFTDKDECKEWGHCDQQCVNTDGSYKCLCNVGFILQGDNRTCRAITVPDEEHKMALYFTHHDQIMKVNLWICREKCWYAYSFFPYLCIHFCWLWALNNIVWIILSGARPTRQRPSVGNQCNICRGVRLSLQEKSSVLVWYWN